MDDTAAPSAGERSGFHNVRDLLFPVDVAINNPTLTIVAGEAGSGRSAVAASIASEENGRAAVVSADDVLMSDPRAVATLRWRPLEAAEVLSGPAAALLQESIAHARASTQSLILEGAFGAPTTVFAVAESFADEGYATRAVLVASRRAESLLAATSLYLWQRQARLPARFTSRESHRRGWESTRALASALEASKAMNRVTVIERGGAVLFDAELTGDRPFAGTTQAVTRADAAPWTPRAAAEWFSELRRATDYARAGRELAPPVADLLLELHRIGLNQILPAMPFPPGSMVVTEQERRLAVEIVDLRRHASSLPRVERPAAQPSSAPAAEPSRPTGPSL